jgi:hypothetical protein
MALAERGNCAVHLVRHTRKPGGMESEVTTESSRGGSSQTDACPVVRPINRLSEKEVTTAAVDNRRLYFRTLHDKANLQPPAEKADWFKLVSVDLGNGRRQAVTPLPVVSTALTVPTPPSMAYGMPRRGRWSPTVS